MEQATIVSYAFGYVAAIIVAVLVLLPVLIPLLLLLLLTGAVLLLVLGVRAVALGLYRSITWLFAALVQVIKTLRDRAHHGGPGGRRLHPH